MIWYLRSPRSQTAAKPKRDEVRGIQGNAAASARVEPAATATQPAAAPSRVAASVTGLTDARATGPFEEPTAKLTQARHDAERTAARLSKPRRDRAGDPDRGGGVWWGAPGRRQVSAVVPDQGQRPIDALPRAGLADLSGDDRRVLFLQCRGGRGGRVCFATAREDGCMTRRGRRRAGRGQVFQRVRGAAGRRARRGRFCQRVRKGTGDPDRGGGERWGAPRRRNARLSLGLPDQGQRHIDALPRAGYANVSGDDRRVLFLQCRGGPGRWVLLDHVLASAGRGAAPRGPTAEDQAARDQLLATPRPDSPLGDSGSELKVALGAICDGPRAHATVAEGRRRAAHHTGRRNHPLSRKRQSRHRGAGDQQHLHVRSVTV